ncbi:MAG: Methyltransferase type 11 [Candidatus Moranbacteria bacterium GW2011_GWE1_49_15]|nr:MAG: Methyltransferase type 11 [Candidatus Moranbacteria bacterium GW2011_GWE1_49_15]
MKTLLIKIGKALEVFKRDGILVGFRRNWKGFWRQFSSVQPGDVLFVTDGVGDSALHRTHHIAEELNLNGIKASVATTHGFFLSKHVDGFKVFVFHRTLHTKKIAKMIEKIKSQGKEIIFDTDDLVYDAEYFKKTEAYKSMNSLQKKLYENGLGSEILNDPYVKTCTTTTSFLADKLREKGKTVFVVPNKLSKKDLEIAEEVYNSRDIMRLRDNRAKRIGYFSGAATNNKNFATVNDALHSLMKKYEDLELFLVGHLDIDSKLNEFGDRIKRHPYADREQHFKNLGFVDIDIAPLEIGDAFCEAKSEIKFFEAGAVGVPIVAAATQTFKEAIEDGTDGFLANGTEEWMEKLEKLILSEPLRNKIGEKAREKVLQKYSTMNAKNEEYYGFLRSKLQG